VGGLAELPSENAQYAAEKRRIQSLSLADLYVAMREGTHQGHGIQTLCEKVGLPGALDMVAELACAAPHYSERGAWGIGLETNYRRVPLKNHAKLVRTLQDLIEGMDFSNNQWDGVIRQDIQDLLAHIRAHPEELGTMPPEKSQEEYEAEYQERLAEIREP
jgi:hypothetical protein